MLERGRGGERVRKREGESVCEDLMVKKVANEVNVAPLQRTGVLLV